MTTMGLFPFYLRIVTATAHLALTAADMCDVGRSGRHEPREKVCPTSRGEGHADCGCAKDWHAVVVRGSAVGVGSARACYSCFRPQIRPSVFRLSRSVAHAKQFW